jgi:iron-sulfur cluster repair protein YtfE (RIC family)
MDQMRTAIQGRHKEILNNLSALSGAVAADAEGVHSFQLRGFLRHKLLPHMHDEERHLYDLVDDLIARHSAGVAATMAIDHQFVEDQIDSIEACLEAARLENAQNSASRSKRRELETLLAQLDTVLRLHLQREEQIYLMALTRPAAREIGRELRRRMRRVYGDVQSREIPSDAGNEGGIS